MFFHAYHKTINKIIMQSLAEIRASNVQENFLQIFFTILYIDMSQVLNNLSSKSDISIAKQKKERQSY
jgi:hypothetical protein